VALLHQVRLAGKANLGVLTCRVELAVVEGAQWEMVASSQLERGGRDLLVGPDLGGVAFREGRRLELTERRLWIRRAELAGDPAQPIGSVRAGKKSALVGVADDLQRHRLWSTFFTRYQRAEEVLG
jgi:hypothetical protein